MPRDLPLSNGRLMINFDHEYNIRDVYYPHVGGDNQTVGDVSFFGVWCDDKFAWIGSPSWEKTQDYEDDTLVTAMRRAHQELGVILEPAGAASLAALLTYPEPFKGQLVASILSGGNITVEQMKQWLAL